MASSNAAASSVPCQSVCHATLSSPSPFASQASRRSATSRGCRKPPPLQCPAGVDKRGTRTGPTHRPKTAEHRQEFHWRSGSQTKRAKQDREPTGGRKSPRCWKEAANKPHRVARNPGAMRRLRKLKSRRDHHRVQRDEIGRHQHVVRRMPGVVGPGLGRERPRLRKQVERQSGVPSQQTFAREPHVGGQPFAGWGKERGAAVAEQQSENDRALGVGPGRRRRVGVGVHDDHGASLGIKPPADLPREDAGANRQRIQSARKATQRGEGSREPNRFIPGCCFRSQARMTRSTSTSGTGITIGGDDRSCRNLSSSTVIFLAWVRSVGRRCRPSCANVPGLGSPVNVTNATRARSTARKRFPGATTARSRPSHQPARFPAFGSSPYFLCG